jgi:hypothetical protein
MVGLISAAILAQLYYARPYTRCTGVGGLLLLSLGGE